MLSSSRLKHVSSLKVAKYRDLHGQTIAEGSKVIKEMLLSGFSYVDVFATERWAEQNTDLARGFGSALTICSEKELERMSALQTPQGVVAVLEIPESMTPRNDFRISLFCDRVSDPGNLGTILRIADWFGIDQVITSPGSVSFYNPKVIQASMGSFFRTYIAVSPLSDLIKQCQGTVSVFGAVMDGDILEHIAVNTPAILVVGNESNGIAPETLAYCTHKVTIPGRTNQTLGETAESLNAAIAAALICYHFSTRG